MFAESDIFISFDTESLISSMSNIEKRINLTGKCKQTGWTHVSHLNNVTMQEHEIVTFIREALKYLYKPSCVVSSTLQIKQHDCLFNLNGKFDAHPYSAYNKNSGKKTLSCSTYLPDPGHFKGWIKACNDGVLVSIYTHKRPVLVVYWFIYKRHECSTLVCRWNMMVNIVAYRYSCSSPCSEELGATCASIGWEPRRPRPLITWQWFSLLCRLYYIAELCTFTFWQRCLLTLFINILIKNYK